MCGNGDSESKEDTVSDVDAAVVPSNMELAHTFAVLSSVHNEDKNLHKIQADLFVQKLKYMRQQETELLFIVRTNA